MTESQRDTLVRPDGARLAVYRWPVERPRAQVVIVHGLAEHAERHGGLAAEASGKGVAVWALDLRGHGRSPGPRAFVPDYATLVADVAALVDRAKEEHPGAGVTLFGHSMGGAIALQLALRHAASLAALALSAPFLVDGARRPAWVRPLGYALARTLPRAPAVRIDAGAISRDQAEVARYRSDPLVHHGAVPARSAVTLDAGGKELLAAAPGLRVPTLVLHGEEDRVAHVDGSRALARASSAVRLVTIPGGYHELHHEPPGSGVPARVRAETLAWVERHAAPPSGIDDAAPGGIDVATPRA